MKSPIASITGLLEIMEQRNAVNEMHMHLFELLKGSAVRAQKTIQALNEAIAYKKTLAIHREKIGFEEILGRVKETLAEPIFTSGTSIHADFSRCPHAYFPAIHLQSILQNMVSNAIKYAKEGEAPKIDIATDREDRQVVLIVKDQGIGLDIQLYGDRLFHLFQRFHTHKEGMGVGLYLVHSIVEAYGGRITVDSNIEQGTIFRIYLGNEYGE